MARTGLMYAAVGTPGTVTADDSIVQMSAGTHGIIIHEVIITSSTSITDEDRVEFRNSLAGTGGVGVFEVALHSRNTVAAQSVVIEEVTTPGTILDRFEAFRFDPLYGFHWLPPPKDRILIHGAASNFVVHALSSMSGIVFTVVWEEI